MISSLKNRIYPIEVRLAPSIIAFRNLLKPKLFWRDWGWSVTSQGNMLCDFNLILIPGYCGHFIVALCHESSSVMVAAEACSSCMFKWWIKRFYQKARRKHFKATVSNSFQPFLCFFSVSTWEHNLPSCLNLKVMKLQRLQKLSSSYKVFILLVSTKEATRWEDFPENVFIA